MMIKRLLKLLAGGVALLLATLVIGGWLLNPVFRVERSLLIQAPAERIYAHLDSSDGWQRWGAWYRRDPQMQLLADARTEGTGAAWSWRSESQGNGRLELTEVEVDRRVAYVLQIEDFTPSSGELRLEPEGQGTRVIWLMQGDVGANPLKRWMALLMDSLVGPDFDAGLANLKTLAEQD
ncbi:MAG: SRPBCC family protein [Inhella sp.]